MTNFSRSANPFTVGSDPATTTTGVETTDVKVSTDGTFHVYSNIGVSAALSVANTVAAGAFHVAVTVSGSVSTKVTADGFLTIFDLNGTAWRVPAFTTLA